MAEEKKYADRRPLDWLSPIRKTRDEEQDRTPAELYGRFASATMDFLTEFVDWPAMRPWWKRLCYLGLVLLAVIVVLGLLAAVGALSPTWFR